MSREQFIAMLAQRLYENQNNDLIVFKDGSMITEDMLCKILDVIKGSKTV